MDNIKELSAAIDHDRIERAKRMKPEDKLWAGAQLFDQFEALAKAGIRDQFPTADEAEVRRIFRERLALLQRAERRA